MIYKLVETIGNVCITHCPEGKPKYVVLDRNCHEIATAATLEYARGAARQENVRTA